jgi:hypothetical protein
VVKIFIYTRGDEKMMQMFSGASSGGWFEKAQALWQIIYVAHRRLARGGVCCWGLEARYQIPIPSRPTRF